MKSLCFTGHRKMPGKEYSASWTGIKSILIDLVIAAYNKGFNTFYCGGAIGFDTAAAEVVLHMRQVYPDIKLVMAIPFRNQPNKWPKHTQEIYYDILGHADEVIYVDEELHIGNPGEYAIQKMSIRNDYMLKYSKAVIAYSNNQTTGGTDHCINTAIGKGIPVLIIDALTLNTKWRLP